MIFMPEWRPREIGHLEELHSKMKQKKNRKHPERVKDADIGVGKYQGEIEEEYEWRMRL